MKPTIAQVCFSPFLESWQSDEPIRSVEEGDRIIKEKNQGSACSREAKRVFLEKMIVDKEHDLTAHITGIQINKSNTDKERYPTITHGF